MKYCSIDIETTGLNHDECDIIQFSAILDDLSDPQPIEKLPTLNIFFIKDGPLVGEPYALSMHSAALLKIDNAKRYRLEEDSEGCRYMRIGELPEALNGFLFANGWTPEPKNDIFYVSVAGKNAGGFDLPFLKNKIKKWGRVKLMQRVMDPAILFFNPRMDTCVPDLQTCMDRAGISGVVTHAANEDALKVVQLLRHKFAVGK